MSFHKLLIIVFLLLFSCNTKDNQNIPAEFKAKVIAIKDGDTIEVLYNGKPLRIRLAHIDCPEKSQSFGKAAKQFTSDMCFGQNVTVINYDGFDRYKRWVAVIVNDKGQTVNKELVAAGLAWHFTKYSSDEEYDKLESVARENKVGLWADQDPTPPWKWRRGNKNK
jgi:endonuclease YncB( thermonuclease family)